MSPLPQIAAEEITLAVPLQDVQLWLTSFLSGLLTKAEEEEDSVFHCGDEVNSLSVCLFN